MNHDPAGDTDSLLAEGYSIDRVVHCDGRTWLTWSPPGKHHSTDGQMMLGADSFERAIAKFVEAASEHRMRIFPVVSVTRRELSPDERLVAELGASVAVGRYRRERGA